MHDGDGSHLLRVLGVAFGIAVVIGGTIGQGILRTPGMVASGVPDTSIIIGLWVLGGIVCLIDAMSTVELAATIRRAGGPYVFAYQAFGPAAGVAVGAADWLAGLGATAFVSVVFGEYLHRLGIATEIPVGLLAAMLILAIGTIHWFGTRIGGRSQEIGSAVKALLFILLIAALMLAPRADPLPSAIAPAATASVVTLAGVVMAIRGIFGTYAGWNSAAYFCEDVRDPGREIARATFVGLIVVMAIYVLMNIALLNVLTPAEMAGSNLVAADAAERVFGEGANGFITAISLISLLTIANASVMVYLRIIFAIGRDAEIPHLMHVARNGTPKTALVVTVVLAAALSIVGIYELLLAFSTSLLTAIGMCVNAAVIVMRVRYPGMDRPYAMPFFPVPAIFAFTVNMILFVMFVQDDPMTAIKAFGLLAIVTGLLYAVMRRRAAAVTAP